MICLVFIGVARVACGRVTTSLDIWEDILKKQTNWCLTETEREGRINQGKIISGRGNNI